MRWRAAPAHPVGGVSVGDRAASRADTDHDPAGLERIEVALVTQRREQRDVRERGGDLGRQTLRVEVRDAPHAGRARHRGFPERFEADAERRDLVHSRDDDSKRHQGSLRRAARIHRRPR